MKAKLTGLLKGRKFYGVLDGVKMKNTNPNCTRMRLRADWIGRYDG